MEVHHHAHTSRKKWTHYFWEFLMLFLAVFCGFLAEYKLELTIEHHKEKEYIETMIEDLQADTSNLRIVSEGLNEIQKSIDTLLIYYDNLSKPADPVLFRNLKSIYGFSVFINADRTIQQLKSSGGMRLIRNKKAADGIMEYDAIIRNYDNNGLYVQRFWENLNFQRISIIDQQDIDTDLMHAGKLNPQKTYLLVNDPGQLKKLKSFIYELKTYHSHTVKDNERVAEKAIALISVLKKEYHVK